MQQLNDTMMGPSPLERFLGEEARVLQGTDIPVNNHVQVRMMDVLLPATQLPEDEGRLYLFPVDDAAFALELFYVKQTDASSRQVTVFSLRFLPAFFEQFPPETLMANQPFRFDRSTEQQFPVCTQSLQLLDQLMDAGEETPLARSLHFTTVAANLLKRALECITVPFTVCQVPACRFLAYDSERDKIHQARKIIEEHIDNPHTIKELSRLVAINECYLKKGFKAMTGKTIHEYQQELRINTAKELLRKDGISVTDVANTLGYSSISHFSTAFKRVTGMKPCELLS